MPQQFSCHELKCHLKKINANIVNTAVAWRLNPKPIDYNGVMFYHTVNYTFIYNNLHRENECLEKHIESFGVNIL